MTAPYDPDFPPDQAWPAARDSAFHWANQAEAHDAQAQKHHEYVNAMAGSNGALTYLRETIAEERQKAAAQESRRAECVALAEMWAKVAAALEPRPDPAVAEAAFRAQTQAQSALAHAVGGVGPSGVVDDATGP